MKIIAFYLPQFHTFPENDKWWGEGFTEWTNVRRARPLFKGHIQPTVPLNNNYYDLTDIEVIKWQAQLAMEYGIYGFCFYHYWFDGKILMNKPMELLLNHPEINIHYCICWANENWTKQWAKKSKEILIGQTYGDKAHWKEHYEYLRPFFKDNRYIKINGNPLFIIYRPELISQLRPMITYWQELAKQDGFDKIVFAYQQVFYDHTKDKNGELFDYGIEYQPGFVRRSQQKTPKLVFYKLLNEITVRFNLPQNKLSTIHYTYEDTWKRILKIVPRDEKMIPGAFVNWDNTPRYGRGASIVTGYTPQKFETYLKKQIERTKTIYKKDFLFIFAWNEWGEGGYLEPDQNEQYARLEAIRNALTYTKEFYE